MTRKLLFCCGLIITPAFVAPVRAQMPLLPSTQLPTQIPTQLPLGANFSGWTGLGKAKNGVAQLSVPGEAIYRVPNGPKGGYRIGLADANDSVLNAVPFYGLRFEIQLSRAASLHLDVTATIPQQGATPHYPDSVSAPVEIEGQKGVWQTVTVPFASFDVPRGQLGILKQIKSLGFKTRFSDSGGGAGQIKIKNVRLVRGDVLALDAPLLSKAADGDGLATYSVKVFNASDAPQRVALALERQGWEGMGATVSPAALSLAPGASALVTLRVAVPSQLPGGARETQTLVATSQTGQIEKLEFITLRRLASPFLVHTKPEWDDVRAKVQKYEWAKQEQAEVVKQAEAFTVPEVAKGDAAKSTDGGRTPALFQTYIEQKMWPCAFAYQLTGEKKYAEKVALFLRRFSSPVNGYPTTLHAVKGDIPQEGGFIETCARAYDSIQDAGVLSEADKSQIEASFRIFIRLQRDSMVGSGGISNWSVFNLCPAAQCALLLHDMESFNDLMYGTSGVVDHLRYGTMDDGWWYEMSIGYNLGCAEAMTSLGLAARPFGIDFLNAKFPASLTQNVGLRRFEYESYAGMAFGKFGPIKNNWVSVKKMWDGILPYPDYRSIIFGIGDSHDSKVSGGLFEKAFYAYRDPAYVPIIQGSGDRDLLYGVSELPNATTVPASVSARSDNAGVALLRSQTANRPQREQIQAVLKYGTHGSYHGHFDRLSLNSLMRYGRSSWNPESSWFGYAHFMYKMWVQTSIAHNMVVVDGKMQEPTEAQTLLFHTGPMMQVTAVENTARWSNPPFLGGYEEQAEGVKTGDVSFLPVPEKRPAKGQITGFTEPVRGRRLMLVTDDYVLLSDDLKAKNEHQFDNLLQLRGARLAEPDKAQFLSRDAQFDTDPFSSGQFITDVSRYAVQAPALVRSEFKISGKDATTGKEWKGDNWNTGGLDDRSEPGINQVDEHVLWPQKSEIAIGNYAEERWGLHKKLTYGVKGDGKSLTSGAFGAWILGSGNIDADVKGLKSLELSTQIGQRGNNYRNSLFWANARLVTEDGREIPLSTLKPTTQNVLSNPNTGKDYEGGPIRIAGVPYADALAAEPQDAKSAAIITFDLSGLNAIRFKAVVGGDWAIGNEDQLRKTVSVRTRGTAAQFLTLIEPYEGAKMVKSAIASGPNALRVELADGRVQDITISGLDGDGTAVSVSMSESRDGKTIRTETTKGEAQ